VLPCATTGFVIVFHIYNVYIKMFVFSRRPSSIPGRKLSQKDIARNRKCGVLGDDHQGYLTKHFFAIIFTI
jgi:hypothetical protein